MHLSRRTYVRTLILQTVKKYFEVYVLVLPVSFWLCLYQKNTTSFSDLQRPFDLYMKHISKLPGESTATHTIQNES